MIRLISTQRVTNSTSLFLNKLYNTQPSEFTWCELDEHQYNLFSVWNKAEKQDGIKNIYRMSGFNKTFLPQMDKMLNAADAIIYQSNFQYQQAFNHYGIKAIDRPHTIIHNGAKIDDPVEYSKTGKVLIFGQFYNEVDPLFNSTNKIDTLYLVLSWILNNTNYDIDLIGPGNHEVEHDRVKVSKNFQYNIDFSLYECIVHTELFSVCSNALIEVQCQGVPVVAFRSGGNTDIALPESLCELYEEDFLKCLKSSRKRRKQTYEFAKSNLNIEDCTSKYLSFMGGLI